MQWKQLSAVFGGLDTDTLLLKEGLNLIYAPNESGKSTWCTFLRTMLYGLPTRDRKLTADKNRYAPWNGKAMEGRAELIADDRSITITRSTARANSPMGSFSAFCTGTSSPIASLSAANCGETLTGVPLEVFERSAFIRQSSMVIDQSAELERRIAALIASGDEGTSFSEIAERLKRQLTKRRYHKSGILPTLEAEIAVLREQLSRSRTLQQQLTDALATLSGLEQQEEDLLRQLSEAAEQGETDAHRELAHLRRQAEQADLLLQEQQATAASLPTRKELSALKSAAGNILINQFTLRSARTQLRLREQELAAAEQPLRNFPVFSSLTGEEANAQATADLSRFQKYRSRRKVLLAAALLPLAAAIILTALILTGIVIAPPWSAALPLPLFPLFIILSGTQKKRAAAILTRYGTEDADILRQTEAYYRVYTKYDAARAAAEEAQQRERRLETELNDSLTELILRARELDAAADDLTSATKAIDNAVALQTRFEAAQQTRDELFARRDALAAVVGDTPTENETTRIHTDLQTLRTTIHSARQQASTIQSQLQLCGSEEQLLHALAEKEAARSRTQKEYDAFALALEALSEANADLQNRFSPELGKKSAKYFAKLTKGKYNTVLLNRELAASVQNTDSSIPHPFWQLSQGTMEQLYLAVRLAICDLVLPKEKSVPLVLDDALSSFDDERMAAALDVLMEMSRERQILFFTCHRREAAYLRSAYPGRFSSVELQ